MKTHNKPNNIVARARGIPPTREDIAVRAYVIYLERGGIHGHSVEDWLQAERELVLSSDAQRPAGETSLPLGLRLME